MDKPRTTMECRRVHSLMNSIDKRLDKVSIEDQDNIKIKYGEWVDETLKGSYFIAYLTRIIDITND